MIKWCVRNKALLLLFSVLLIAGGIFAYDKLERQENPLVMPPIALVTCVYPGASPEDVERMVVKPLEKKIGTMDSVKTLESFSMDSVAIIKVTVKDLSDQEIGKCWETLKDKVDQAEVELPGDAEKPEVNTELANSYGYVIGLSSEHYTYSDLKRLAKELEGVLEAVSGVAEVKLSGTVDQEVSIDLDMSRLHQFGISPATITTALQARNIDIPGGNMEFGAVKVPVQISGVYKNPSQLGETVVGVSEKTGLPVQLKELAQVRLTDAVPDRYAQVGKNKAILLGVRFEQKRNLLTIEKELNKALEEFKTNTLYSQADMTVLANQARSVDEAIGLFVSNLVTAVILVVAVVWLFMGLRSAVIVSVPIVLVTAIVILYMKFTAIPLHQISIASLIICLSLMVANGIVANDNMYLYLQQGRERSEAILNGVRDVNIPILTSTLTTIASFLPLAMMYGSAGKFAKALPILVSVALIASYITSLTVVPAMGDRMLQVRERSEGILGKCIKALRMDHAGKFLMRKFDRSLEAALTHPRKTLAFFLTLLVLTSFLVPLLGIKVFPPVERRQYVLTLKYPNGYSLEETKLKVQGVAQLLSKEASVDSYGMTIGDGFIQYYDTFEAARRGGNIAEIIVNGDRAQGEAVASKIAAASADVNVTVKFLELNMPSEQPVQIRISGKDIKALKAYAQEIEKKTRDMKGVWSTAISFGQDTYKLKVDVDESRANLSGITNYDVATTVRMAVNGLEIGKIKPKDVDGDDLPIVMRLGKSDFTNVAHLSTVFLTSQITGANVPLSQVATFNTAISINEIIRRNEARTITVGLYLNQEASSEKVLIAVQKAMEGFPLEKGYRISYGGDNEFAEETFSSMVIPAIAAIVLIYLIMAIQFGDLSDPLLIMGTIPLSFIGIFSGLWIMRYPIGFMAMLGVISLMGVVVNNGIVLIDYIKLLEREGISSKDAAREAARTRMRPILIGMLTTVISLIPMMINGGPLWQPLATALNCGLVVSTLLTLIGIPAGYQLIHPDRNTGIHEN